MFEFIAFLISIVVILIIARKNLWLALLLGSVLLGLSVLGPASTLNQFIAVLSEPSIQLLALAVALIPLIGGVMEETGQMKHLVKNLRIGKKAFLGFAPALLGMLPIPGGALMSAPLIERAGKNLTGKLKSAINVWFRHVLLLVYPLSPSLIASAKMANIELYSAIIYIFPFMLFALFVGYWFFLRKSPGTLNYSEKFSLKWLLVPLAIILSAPFIDVLLKVLFQPQLAELSLVIAVSAALSFAFLVGKPDKSVVKRVLREMKPWTFSIIIFGMFFFLYVFKASPLPEMISDLPLTPAVLLVLFGFFLGFATGRMQVPAAIVIPVFLAKFAVESMPLQAFALMYFSIFLGYALSPVHPCVSLTLEFFKTDLPEYFKELIFPTVIALGVAFLLAFFIV